MAQDYILRLVEQAAQFIAAMWGFRKTGRSDEAVRRLESESLQIAGLPLSLVRKAPPEALWQFLAQGGALQYGRAVMLAELLLIDAEICQEELRPVEALHSKEQALHLLAESIPTLSRDDAAHFGPRLEALAEEMDPLHENEWVWGKIAEYRAQWGM